MTENENDSMENWEIDMLCPKDAPGLVELYRAIYGDDYPVKTVYEPEELIRQSQTGDSYRVVARTESGQVVGHIAIYRSVPSNPGLYECGQMMVRHDYRTSKIAFQIYDYAMKEIPSRYGIETVWGEAVCNHIFTQRGSLQQGFYQTAIEVDLMPGESYAKALDDSNDSARVSTVVYFRTFKVKPQTIYLPPVYEQIGTLLYEGFDYGHTFVLGEAVLPQQTTTVGDIKLFAGAGVARLTFDEIGADFVSCLNKMEQEARDGGAVVTQVSFRLTRPWTGAVADILRQRGYFIGGCLPRWFDEDGFLMQKIDGEPNFDGMKLYGKRAKQIAELIKQDWQEVTSSR